MSYYTNGVREEAKTRQAAGAVLRTRSTNGTSNPTATVECLVSLLKINAILGTPCR